METLQVGTTPLLAILADDHRKAELLDVLRSYCGDLKYMTLLATRDTGNLVRSRLGMDVALVQSGSRGGALQIAALVVEGAVSAVVALHRPSMMPEENVGTMALRQGCDIHDVPFASNLATADAVLAALVRRHSEKRLSGLGNWAEFERTTAGTTTHSVSREE